LAKKKASKKPRGKLEKAQAPDESRAGAALRVITDRRMIGVAILFVATCAALFFPLIGGATYRPGDIARVDIVSPKTVKFEDKTATENQRARAAQKIGAVYRLEQDYKRDIEFIFKEVLAGVSSQPESAARKESEKALFEFGLETDTVEKLLSLEKDEPVRLRLQTYAVMNRFAQGEQIDEETLERLGETVKRNALAEGVDADMVPMLQNVIGTAVRKNLIHDADATEKKRKQAMENIVPEMRTIRKGEVVVRKGDQIEESDIEALRAMGLESARASWGRLGGMVLLVIFIFGVMGVFLKTLAPDVYKNEKKMFIFYMIVFLTVATCVLISAVDLFSGYLLGAPVAAATILICVLLRPVLALVMVPSVVVAIAMPLGIELKHFLVATIAGLAAYFYSVRPQDRDSLLKAGAAVSLGNMALIFILTMISFESWQRALMDVVVFGGLNGVVASVVAMGSMPAFERIFNVTTPHRLLELSNPEEPLLKQMLIQAPGTYYHSFFVGNLAETVAASIGANSLLVRIACYYHDIGTLKRPYFFVENQMHGQSPLSEVTPTMGALVISSHVKDGAEMARESNLPQELVDIISEHHGTTLISFFHQKARADAPEGKEVAEERFRYPGPKPRTAESAIVMLADACEAAVRAMKKPTPRQIESTVDNLVESRLFDGQFDECNITLKQIDTMRLTLIKTLANIYHTRMEYPDLEDFKKQKDSHKNNVKRGNLQQDQS